MNDRRPYARLIRALPLAAMIALAGCGGGGTVSEPPLAGAKIGGPFALTDQDGKTVRDSDFAGRYRLIYFGYSFCPDVCPVDLQNIAKAYSLFEKENPQAAAKLQPIFITVDPARDTPAVLKDYVAAFHPRLIGLTGSEAQIAAVAKEYAIFYRKAGAAGAADYLVDHARQATLFGPEGEPMALLPQEESPEAIVAVLKQWVR